MLLMLPALAWPATTERINLDPLGLEADGPSIHAIISTDGRFVSFWSTAGNLVAGDTNGTWDVFVYERATGAIERVSVGPGGIEANGGSYGHAISGNGRYVTFFSEATNLVAGDNNMKWDIFIHDRTTGVTERVSVDSGGAEADGDSFGHAITTDGRYVVFDSVAGNLVTGDTNGAWDIFIHDRTTGTTERVSVDSLGAEANADSYFPTISADGRYVLFESNASNLVAGDTNGATDVFLHDRDTGDTVRVSVDSSGQQADGISSEAFLSPEGRYVVFESAATNLVAGDTNGVTDVFFRDLTTGVTERVSVDDLGIEGNDHSHSHHTTIAGNGRYVLFVSHATNLVANDTNLRHDAFLRDRMAGTTERVSVDSGDQEANADSDEATMSGDGRYITFESAATNLVAGDTSVTTDIFLRTRNLGAGGGGCAATGLPASPGDAAGMLLTLLAALLWTAVRRRARAANGKG